MIVTVRQLVACAVAAVLLGAGCAGDEVETDSSRPGPADRRSDELPANVVARVADEDITRREAAHWIAAARKQGDCKGAKACREQAMQFLVSAEWLIQHARESKVVATEKEIDREFNKQKRKAFASESGYREFLRNSGRSEADLRFQVKLAVLTNKLQESIVGSEQAKTQQQRLDAFVVQFQRRYKRQTTCRRKYAAPKQCGKLV